MTKTAFWRTERTESGVRLCTDWETRNMHRVAEYEGLLGNRKEPSWNRRKNQHDCCGAKVSWRHHKDCPDRALKQIMESIKQ